MRFSLQRTLASVLSAAMAAAGLLLATPAAAQNLVLRPEIVGNLPCEEGEDFVVRWVLDTNRNDISVLSATTYFPRNQFTLVRNTVSNQFEDIVSVNVGEATGSGTVIDAQNPGSINITAISPTTSGFGDGVLFESLFRVEEDNLNNRFFLVDPQANTSIPSVSAQTTSGFPLTGDQDLDDVDRITCQGTPGNQPTVLYDADFEGNADGWRTNMPDGFTSPSFSFNQGGISLSPAGQTNVFGYWSSPPINVPAGSDLEVLWTVITNRPNSELSPAFRLRVNETLFRYSDVVTIESTTGGVAPNNTASRVYRQLVDLPAEATQIELAFDQLSFLPQDDLNTITTLQNVTVRELDLSNNVVPTPVP